MRFITTGILLLGAMALPTPAAAQTNPAPPAITRTVVAATKLSTVTDAPLHFKAVSVTLPAGREEQRLGGQRHPLPDTGTTEVSLGGKTKMLNAGEGLFIGETAALTAGSGGPSTFLHFFLVPAVDLGRPAETAPAAVSKNYIARRSRSPT